MMSADVLDQPRTSRRRTLRSSTAGLAAGAFLVGGLAIGATDTVPLVSATASSGERAIYQPITPCRLADTRPAFQVGPRNTPVGQDEIWTIAARGANGDCSAAQLPTDATGLQLNITALGATNPTFLAVFPDGTDIPTSSLNPVPGQPPVPNAVTTGVATDGSFRIYNRFGTVNVIVDVVGIYRDHDHDDRYDTSSEVDTKIADAIDALPDPATGLDNVITVSASGGDFTDPAAAVASITDASAANPYTVIVGPGTYTLTTPIVLPQYVHLQGSGRATTRVSGTFTGTALTDSASAVVVVDDGVEISDITIVNPGAMAGPSSGIFGDGATQVTIDDVDVEIGATGADGSSAIYVANGSFRIDETTAINNGGDGFGIYGVNDGEATISNSWVNSTLFPTPFGAASRIECDFVIFDSPFEPSGAVDSNCLN